MKMWKLFLMVLVSVVLIFVAIGFSLDSTYKISRSRLMKAEQSQIWESLKDLKKWPEWSPWIQADTTMQMTFSEVTQGPGAKMQWVSEHSGEGSQVFLASKTEESLDTELSFGESGKAKSRWELVAKGEDQKQTLVTWSFSGEMGNDIIGRYMGLLMDRFMGPFFEKGLENLEKAAIKNPATSQVLEAPELVKDSNEVSDGL